MFVFVNDDIFIDECLDYRFNIKKSSVVSGLKISFGFVGCKAFVSVAMVQIFSVGYGGIVYPFEQILFLQIFRSHCT